jgi:hypothetical protein
MTLWTGPRSSPYWALAVAFRTWRNIMGRAFAVRRTWALLARSWRAAPLAGEDEFVSSLRNGGT